MTEARAQRFRPSSFVFRHWRLWFRIAVHLGSLVPLALLVWDGAHDHLTANPIQEITFRTGRNALKLLLLSLACTPAANVLGFTAARLVRRPLGLYAFFYATLHLLTFAVVDYGLDWRLIEHAIVEKRYVLAGFAAFTLLVPLALTSTKGWQRRLRRRWFALHRLVYASAVLVIVHFLWLSKGDVLLLKGDIRRPALYGLVLLALLSLRLPALQRAARRWRSRRVVRKGHGATALASGAPDSQVRDTGAPYSAMAVRNNAP